MFSEDNATSLGMIDTFVSLVFISSATVCCVLQSLFSCVTLMFLKRFFNAC